MAIMESPVLWRDRGGITVGAHGTVWIGEDRVDPEADIRDARQAGDLAGAATRAIETYGPEVLGFLVTLLRDEDAAGEVFSQACEDLWTGMKRFEGRSSFRTWFYVLARHAASRFRRAPHRRGGRHAGLSALTGVAERVRSQTLPHLRTEVKDHVTAIRESLPEEDRALLVLRVDRAMSWNDIARVFSPEDDSSETIARVGARLRKRFQLVKDEIRARAREAGLLQDEEPQSADHPPRGR
jgi:RNA polymerase sigma-70 factor, ECF subfamily